MFSKPEYTNMLASLNTQQFLLQPGIYHVYAATASLPAPQMGFLSMVIFFTCLPLLSCYVCVTRHLGRPTVQSEQMLTTVAIDIKAFWPLPLSLTYIIHASHVPCTFTVPSTFIGMLVLFLLRAWWMGIGSNIANLIANKSLFLLQQTTYSLTCIIRPIVISSAY